MREIPTHCRGQVEHILRERWAPGTAERVKMLVGQIEWVLQQGRESQIILDCACGLGELLESLTSRQGCCLEFHSRHCFEGIDIDPACAKESRKWAAKEADACAMPFADNSRDIVVAAMLIEHVENPTQLLREIHRVSKRWALISTPNAMRPAKVWSGMKRELRWERSGHRQTWDYHLFRQVLENNGFKVHRIDVRFVDFPWGHRAFPWLAKWLSHGPLKRAFPWLGSEMYAVCEKTEVAGADCAI